PLLPGVAAAGARQPGPLGGIGGVDDLVRLVGVEVVGADRQQDRDVADPLVLAERVLARAAQRAGGAADVAVALQRLDGRVDRIAVRAARQRLTRGRL